MRTSIILHMIHSIWKLSLCQINQYGCLLASLRMKDKGSGRVGGGVGRRGDWCHLLYRDLPLKINTPCIPTKQSPIKQQRTHNWPWVQGAGWLKHSEEWCDSQWASSQLHRKSGVCISIPPDLPLASDLQRCLVNKRTCPLWIEIHPLGKIGVKWAIAHTFVTRFGWKMHESDTWCTLRHCVTLCILEPTLY